MIYDCLSVFDMDTISDFLKIINMNFWKWLNETKMYQL